MIGDLLQIQTEDGWISEDRLHALALEKRIPLHRLESLTSFYTHFRREPPEPVRIDVCRDLACALAGANQAGQALRQRLGQQPGVEIREVSCLGRCDRAPAAVRGERNFCISDPEKVLSASDGDPGEARDEIPKTSGKTWAEATVYARTADHYSTLKAALADRPERLPEILDASGLRGMGGAAFPTGRKWSGVAATPAEERHVIANADESEPGSFKDREILLHLPHLLIEGMALAGYAVGARRGTLFIRREYAAECRAVEAALSEARSAGALGRGIFGSSFDFEIEVFVSPGGYILGEETALLECLEDRRGEPRSKPPFPSTSGLLGRPTLINNVETLTHATAILHHGADWWHERGLPGFSGHKFLSVSGDVAAAGVHLLPFGTPLRELLELCGGMRDGGEPIALAPGGASSRFLPASALDLPIDFQSLSDAGSMLGSGAVVFISEQRNLLEVGLNLTRFFRNESCGKCVPCRIGTEKAVEWLEAEGEVSPETRERLEELHALLARTSLCGLGQVALESLLSLAKLFPERMRGD